MKETALTPSLIHPRLLLAPDPRLRCPSAEVTAPPDQLTELVILLKEVMEACRDVGINTYSISAPQVGEMLRLFVISSPAVEMVAINPVITKTRGEQTRPEGCLSFPVGTQYAMKRANVVKFHYTDLTGVTRSAKFHDLYAALVQHEIDHLNGVLIDDNGMPVFGSSVA